MKISMAGRKLFIGTHAPVGRRYGSAAGRARRWQPVRVLLLIALLCPISLLNINDSTGHSSGMTGSSNREQNVRAQLNKSYAQLPLVFEQNQGQLDKRVKFLARGAGADLYMTSNEVVLSLARS